MKKLLYISVMAIMALSVSSCGTGSGSSSTSEFTITSGQWVANGTAGTSNYAYVYAHTMSSITQSIVDYGYVLCYIKFVGTPVQYAPLPLTQTYSGYTVNYNFQYEQGTLFIVRKDSDLNTVAPSGSITIKAVVVSTRDMPLLEGVDKNDFQAVNHALQLEE